MTLNTFLNTDDFETQFVKEELCLQRDYAEAIKSATDVDKVYLYDNTGYFTDAQKVMLCDVTVKKKDGKYAVLVEAAQHNMSMDVYQQWSGQDVQLGVDEFGCFI